MCENHATQIWLCRQCMMLGVTVVRIHWALLALQFDPAVNPWKLPGESSITDIQDDVGAYFKTEIPTLHIA